MDLFDDIRSIFAKASGQSKSLFSYNGQGSCPICKGRGYIKLDMAYMGDVEQLCEKCGGKRYNNRALSFKWHNLNIYELLQLTIEEADKLFSKSNIFKNLIEANLGYVKLGQSLDTFSGGELQRLKIAKILNQKEANLLILDEPSTGLHETDVHNLLILLKTLVQKGKTLIILEHNLQLISQAQWIVDMGPAGGNLGGKVLFEGYPIDLLKVKDSYTARHLYSDNTITSSFVFTL